MGGSPDTLSVVSRAFYERSKMKCALGLLILSLTVMVLGFCSNAAGLAQSTNIYAKQSGIPDDLLKGIQNYAGGAGFAAFCFVIAFFILLVGGVYYSPFFCGGTAKEKRMLRSPFDIEAEDSGAAASTASPEL